MKAMARIGVTTRGTLSIRMKAPRYFFFTKTSESRTHTATRGKNKGKAVTREVYTGPSKAGEITAMSRSERKHLPRFLKQLMADAINKGKGRPRKIKF